MLEKNADEYMATLCKAIASIDRKKISEFADILLEKRDSQRLILVFGNGGSATTAAHFVCDLSKMASYGKEKRFRAVCLSDNVPTMMAYANDVSYSEIFIEQAKNLAQKGDLAIAISGSGNSPNVLEAIDYCNAHGIDTVGICGYGGGQLSKKAKFTITLESKDMQVVEDAHLAILHCASRLACGNGDGR